MVGIDEFTYKAWDDHAYSKPAKVSITVTPAPPETAPAFESVTPRENGQTHIVLRSRPGKDYRIAVSTNLVDWSLLLETRADGQRISITDTNSSGSTARFYR